MRGVMVYGDGEGIGDVNHMVASAKLRDETIQLYESAWTAIVQPRRVVRSVEAGLMTERCKTCG
jgi:hypothetical protein